MPKRPTLLLSLFVLILLTATAKTLAQADVIEPREVYDADSPDWLRAVGKLEVPGHQYHSGYRKHQKEDCSGTLVAPSPNSARADVVITAWHCLEFYGDLSRPILFTLLPGSENAITREAYRLADGGGMHADWALLKLMQPVSASQVQGLTPHPDRATEREPVTMAGYSGDSGLGAEGSVLTYHPNCRITRQDQRESESDCSAYKGASGGAVVQVSGDGQARYSGVISRGDSSAISIYVPVTGFRLALKQALN